jgi:superfamily II DNA or RNA helicase
MLRDKGIPFEYDKIESGDELKISREDFLEFIKSLKIPFEPYDYQINAALDSINNKRLLIRSATGSGKSLIIYLIFRYMYKNDVKCVLVCIAL